MNLYQILFFILIVIGSKFQSQAQIKSIEDGLKPAKNINSCLYDVSHPSLNFINLGQHRNFEFRNAGKQVMDSVIQVKNPQSQQPIPVKKMSFDYDEDGFHLSTIHFNWISSWQSWEPIYKDEYAYDQEGLLSRRYRKKWEIELELFEDFQRMEYQYEGDKLMQIHIFSFNYISGWEENYRFIFQYDNSGFLSNELQYELQPNDLWYGVRRKIFHFGEDGFLKREIVKEVNPQLLQWENAWEINYEFEQGNLIKSEKYSWSQNAGIWYEAEIITYEYDHLVESQGIALPITSIPSFNKLEQSSIYDFEIEVEDYVLTGSSQYYYCDQDVNVDELIGVEFEIFPNPLTDRIFIKANFNVENYQIYGMDGKYIKSGLLESAQSIDVSSLYAGHYVLVVKHQNKFSSSTFIKN